jgi:hypothetical protein
MINSIKVANFMFNDLFYFLSGKYNIFYTRRLIHTTQFLPAARFFNHRWSPDLPINQTVTRIPTSARFLD